MQNSTSTHTTASINSLLCALEGVSAYQNQSLSRKATDSDRVRPSAYPSQPDGRAPSAHESRTTTPAWSQPPFRSASSSLAIFPCALRPFSAHNTLVQRSLVCTGARFCSREPPSRRNGQSNSRRGEPLRSSPSCQPSPL